MPAANPAPMRAKPLPSERVLITVLGFYMMLQAISTDLYLPSLPGIARTFGVPPSTVALTLSVFVLVYGTMQLVLGPLSDRYGRHPALVGGLALYCGASIVAAQAPTIGVLIGARAVQAIGCCGVVVAARAIVRDAYTPSAGARVLAQASSILAFGPLLGPLLGGLLEVRYGFRGAFVVLALVSAALLAVTLRLKLETAPATDPQALRPRTIAGNYLAVLRSRPFLAYTLVASTSYGNLFAFISGSSFVLIGVLGVPTTLYGLCFAFCVVGYLVGTIACRHLLARHGIARAMQRGAWLALASSLALCALALAGVHHWAALLLPAAGIFLSHGINFPCAQAGSVAPFPRLAGAAAGMFGFLLMVAAAAIGTLIGATHDGTVYPLVFTMTGCGLLTFAAVRLFVSRLPAADA